MAYDPRIWALELDTAKSENGRSGLKGIRRFGEAALFSRTVGVAYDPKTWPLKSGQRKAEMAIQV